MRAEDQERLVRVGPGTPAGELFRRYWQPAALSSELAENDGAPVRVRLLGEDLPVHARIHTINGFSAHADQDELIAWHRQVGAARTFLVHGDAEVMQKFAAKLGNTRVDMPQQGQVFEF